MHVTSSIPPQPDQPIQAPVVSPVSPVSLSSPIAPLIIEKKRSSAFSLLLGVALVVAVGGVAFAAGRLTAPPSTSASGARGGNGSGFGGGGTGATGAPGAFGGAGFGAGAALTIEGTVQAITPTQLSITLASGQTIQIPVDASTTYHGQAAASASDVKTGQQVQVQVAGGIGRIRGQGGQGGQGGTGGGQASAPPAVGAPGTAPSAGTGTGGQGGGQAGGQGGFGQGGALGPARDITIVTP
jgi:hypothetical protein